MFVLNMMNSARKTKTLLGKTIEQGQFTDLLAPNTSTATSCDDHLDGSLKYRPALDGSTFSAPQSGANSSRGEWPSHQHVDLEAHRASAQSVSPAVSMPAAAQLKRSGNALGIRILYSK